MTTGISAVHLIDGRRATVANGFQKQFPSSSSCSGPRHTWNHVQTQGSAPEIPTRATFLAAAADSREDGDPLDSCPGRNQPFRWELLPSGQITPDQSWPSGIRRL